MEFSKEEIERWAQKLIDKTRNAGIWPSWRVELRMNDKGEMYLTDFLSPSVGSDDIVLARMHSWDVRTAPNSFWNDYVKEAYEEITQKQVIKSFSALKLLLTEGVEEMAFERCDQNYDDKNILFGLVRYIEQNIENFAANEINK